MARRPKAYRELIWRMSDGTNGKRRVYPDGHSEFYNRRGRKLTDAQADEILDALYWRV